MSWKEGRKRERGRVSVRGEQESGFHRILSKLFPSDFPYKRNFLAHILMDISR